MYGETRKLGRDILWMFKFIFNITGHILPPIMTFYLRDPLIIYSKDKLEMAE